MNSRNMGGCDSGGFCDKNAKQAATLDFLKAVNSADAVDFLLLGHVFFWDRFVIAQERV